MEKIIYVVFNSSGYPMGATNTLANAKGAAEYYIDTAIELDNELVWKQATNNWWIAFDGHDDIAEIRAIEYSEEEW